VSASTSCGKTSTAAPAAATRRRIERLQPKSTTATRTSPSLVCVYGSFVETSATSAAPAICGWARTASSTSSTATSPAAAAARIAPRSRRCSTSERVSTPVSATMPWSWSQSVQCGPRASRITTAFACARRDSDRASSTP
jgi:hypothetical protein